MAAIQGYITYNKNRELYIMLHVTLNSKSWSKEVIITSDCQNFVAISSRDNKGVFYAGVVELENVDAELFSAFLISSMNKTGRLEAVTISAEYEESGIHYDFEARTSETGSGYLVPWGKSTDSEREGERDSLTYSELQEYMTEDLLTMNDDTLECYHAIHNTYCNIELYSLTIHDLAHGDKKSLMIERLQNYLIYIRHKIAVFAAKHQKAA